MRPPRMFLRYLDLAARTCTCSNVFTPIDAFGSRWGWVGGASEGARWPLLVLVAVFPNAP